MLKDSFAGNPSLTKPLNHVTVSLFAKNASIVTQNVHKTARMLKYVHGLCKDALGLTGNEEFRGKKIFELDNFVWAVLKRLKRMKRPRRSKRPKRLKRQKRPKRPKRPRRPRRIGKQLKHLKQILVNWMRRVYSRFTSDYIFAS